MNATKSSGLSSVQKACRILSELSDPGPHRLSNIVGNTGINKATAIRLRDMLVGRQEMLAGLLRSEAQLIQASLRRRPGRRPADVTKAVKTADASA